MDSSNVASRELWDRVAESWCRLAHPQPMWPIHGHYLCPKCLRRHAVAWDNNNVLEPEPAMAARQASPRAPLFGGGRVAAAGL